jgi:bifunctional oligoribonuclease and PAP phosphatase NrnA
LPSSSANSASPAADPRLALLQRVRAARRVLLTGPVDPDGDSLGACLALARLVRAVSGAEVDVAGEPASRYHFLPGVDGLLPDAQVQGPYDLAVVLDGDRTRLPAPVSAAFAAAGATALIDHHRSTDAAGYDLAWLDPAAASTTEMVHELLAPWGVPLDPTLATLLYTGLVFDTGGFRHSNTTPATLRRAAELIGTGIDHSAITVAVIVERRPEGLRLLAETLRAARLLHGGRANLAVIRADDLQRLGADKGDVEGIVDGLLYVRGVEVACLVVERSADPAAPLVRLSLRSRSDLDVSALARAAGPGGGGHARAAGVALREPLDGVLARLPDLLADALAGRS